MTHYHVGGDIARHKRVGRIELRDGKLYATQSAKTEQRAAVDIEGNKK